MRLERQTREHQAALAEADQKLLQTQEELDKVRANGRSRGKGQSAVKEKGRRCCLGRFGTRCPIPIRPMIA